MKLGPKEIKVVNEYFVRPVKNRLKEIFMKKGLPQLKTPDEIQRPQRALDKEAIDAFMKRNPKAEGGRMGFDNGGRALYKEITPVTDANRASFMGAAKISEDLKYKVQIPTRSDLSGGIPGLKTIYGKTKKELQEKINNSPITKMDYSKGLVKTKLPEGAVNFDKGRIKIPTGEFLGTGRNKAEIFIIKGKDPNAAIRYTAAGAGGGKKKLYNSVEELTKAKELADKVSKGRKIEYFNPSKFDLENTLKDLYKKSTIKTILKNNNPTDKDIIKVAKILGGTEGQAQEKLVQLFDAMNPEGTRTIDGIPKINKTKANKLKNFYQGSKLSQDIVDKAIGQSVGEDSLAKSRSKIQDSLKTKNIIGMDTDEALRRSGSYMLGSKPYSIFGQIIKSGLNQNEKQVWDAASTKFERTVKETIAAGKDPTGVIKAYNRNAKEYEEKFNKNKRPGAKKVKLPRITDKSPGIAIKNKDAYEKYKRFFNKNYDELGYSFEIPKDLKPIPQIVEELKDSKNLAKAEKAFQAGDARIYSNPMFNPGILKEAFKQLPTPAGAVGLNLLLGVDPTSAVDRASIAAEAAFAPQLVKQAAKLGTVGQKIANLGLTPAMAARAARIASPLGIASLGLEGAYQLGKFTKKRINELRSMTPEQREELRIQGEAQAFDPFQAAGGGIAKQSGDRSGAMLTSMNPDKDGLPGLLKRGKKQ